MLPVRPVGRSAPWFAALLLSACVGAIAEPQEDQAGETGGPTAGTPQPGADSTPPGAAGARPEGPGDRPGVPTPVPAMLTCKPQDARPGPRRLWRLTGLQYRNTVAALFEGRATAARPQIPVPAAISAPFDFVNGSDRFSNFAASYTMTDVEMLRVFQSASDVAGLLVERLRADKKSCLATRSPFAACLRSLIADKGELLLRRPLTDEEVSGFTALGLDNLAKLSGGEDEAAAFAFQALLVSPHFIFRAELGEGAPDARGRVRLSSYEIAAALSYAVTDAPPDDQLWAAAKTGQLATNDQIKAQALRLLQSAADRPAVTRFFDELFDYRGTLLVAKDDKQYKFHDPNKLIDDTVLFLRDVLTQNGRRDFLKTLLTTPRIAVQPATAQNYNVTLASGAKPQLMEAPQRSGILTQPSFLSARSLSDRNEPVQRGRFVSQNLLCREVPDLPINVQVTLLDLGPNATLRQRLVATTKDPACQGCHTLMNPLGFAFESYNHLGQHRTVEAGQPTDASGILTDAGDASGPFKDAIELTHRLAASKVVEQCLARQTFTYLAGREATAEDGCSIVDAAQSYARTGGDYLDLIATLMSSPVFVERRIN